MTHKFPKQEIPSGKEWVNQRCSCGVLRRKCANGIMVYQQADGTLSLKIPKCSREKKGAKTK